ALVLDEEPHGHDTNDTVADATLDRFHLLLLALAASGHAARDPEHAGYGEAPHIGVEDTDLHASGGECGGEVRGDRGLADPAFAGGDEEDLGLGGDRGVLGQLGHVETGLGHGPGLLLLGHLTPVDLHRADAGGRGDPVADVALYLA